MDTNLMARLDYVEEQLGNLVVGYVPYAVAAGGASPPEMGEFAPPREATDAIEPADEGLVDLVLMERCDRPVAIEQAMRQFTNVPLKQAHKMVEQEPLPRALITQLPRRQAEALKLEFESVGAIFELRPAGAPGAPTDLR